MAEEKERGKAKGGDSGASRKRASPAGAVSGGAAAAGGSAAKSGAAKSGAAKIREAKDRAADAAKSASDAAARVGRQTREIGEAVQKRVGQDLAPLAEKAGKELGKAQKSLGRFFKSTARATKKSARILGIKSRISAKVRETERLYQSIGERYYQGQKKSAAAATQGKALKPLVAEVDRIVAEITALEAEEKAIREGP